MHLKRLLTLVVSLLGFSLSNAQSITPAFDKDVERFAAIFSGKNHEAAKEALTQLSWAGLTDPRIYDPLVRRLKGEKSAVILELEEVFAALTMSGNPAVISELEKAAQHKKTRGDMQQKIRSHLEQFDKYQRIAKAMSVGLDSAKTNEELWAIRHKTGLAVEDIPRVRLAARDLYLYRYGRESLEVAAQTLRDNSDKVMYDPLYIDAMAFLCKALGVSGKREYLDTLTYVANTSKTKKVTEHAESAAHLLRESLKTEK